MLSDSPGFNLPLPTLGGRQFWGDLLHFRGWRIQEHVYTRHCRLLDPRDVRRAWGTRAQCETTLDRIKAERQLPPLDGRVVILIHGITRSSKVMSPLESALRLDGYEVVAFDYPSTRVSIPESARYLQQVLESLDAVERIDLVVHSLGGLIVRSYLQQTGDAADPRLHRMVMIGTPNHGARLANIARDNLVFKTLFGPAGQQLVEGDDGLIAALPTPQFEFAVIAGAAGHRDGFNPWIPGDDDGVVSLQSVLLAGAADSLQVRCRHSSLPRHEPTIAATRRFLQHGALRECGRRQPVPPQH